MAITPTIVLPSPAIITTGEPTQIGLNIVNSEASAVTINGIEMFDANGIFVIGEFSPAVQVRYDTYTSGSTSGPGYVGTPVTASVPDWGSGLSQSNIVYYPGNVSGSTWSIVSTSGSYGGGSGSLAAKPNWVVLPANSTGSFSVGAVSNLFTDVSGSALVNSAVGNIQVRITANNSASYITGSGTNSLYLVSKVIKGAALTPVGVPNIVTRNIFGQSPIYVAPVGQGGSVGGFNAPVQTSLVFQDDTSLDISTWDIRNDYTSSNPAAISIVRSGSYTSTSPLTTLTNSVGSIYGGQNTQITAVSGGAGAMTFLFAGNDSVTVATSSISNRLGATLTGSMTMGVRDAYPIAVDVFPALSGMVSGSTLNLTSRFLYNNGVLGGALPEGAGGFQPTYSVLQGSDLVSVNATTGVVTALVNAVGTAIIQSSVAYNNTISAGGTILGYATISTIQR